MKPVNVFISYSHKDEAIKNILSSHLRVLERRKRIEVWDDTGIKLGKEWEEKIIEALNEAQIAILLVSANFLDSTFICEQELPLILERRAGGLAVIPVIVLDCPWQEVEWLTKLQFLNLSQINWKDADSNVANAAAELARKIEELARDIQNEGLTEIEPQPEKYSHLLFISALPDYEDGRRFFLKSLFKRRQCLNGRKNLEQSNTIMKLLDIVRAEISGCLGESASRIICCAKDDGVVAATFDDPGALLRSIISVAPKLRAQCGLGLRIGLHSEVVEAKTSSDLSGLPDRGVDAARRVMALGYGGHILATREAANFFRERIDFQSLLQSRFDLLFHKLSNLELRPLKLTDVYNIYDKELGSPAPPRQKVSDRIIRKIKIPRTFFEDKDEKIKIAFCHDLPYVKVQFKFDNRQNSDIKVRCGNPEVEDCAFEFDFDNLGHKREQVFHLAFGNIRNGSSATINLHCFDRYGEEIIRPIPRRIKLRRSYILWLWDRLKFSKWYYKLAGAIVMSLIIYPFLSTHYQGAVKIGIRYWPRVMKEFRNLEFKKAGEDIKLLSGLDSEETKLEGGLGGEPDGALVVTGPRIITINPVVLGSKSLLGTKSFYDFKIDFAVKLRPGSTRVGWILRAQPDVRGGLNGYLFILEKNSDDRLTLQGKILDNGKEGALLDELGPRDVPVGKYGENDWVNVVLTASEFGFRHEIRIKSGNPEVPDAKFQLVMPDFEDNESKRLRYGNMGLWEPEKNEVLLDRWRMLEIGYGNLSIPSTQ